MSFCPLSKRERVCGRTGHIMCGGGVSVGCGSGGWVYIVKRVGFLFGLTPASTLCEIFQMTLFSGLQFLFLMHLFLLYYSHSNFYKFIGKQHSMNFP